MPKHRFTKQKYDLIVIGAGIAGASVAAYLAQSSKVLLLERETLPGYHATGRSAAYFSSSYGSAAIRAFTRASESFYRRPPQGFTDLPLLRPRETLYIARAEQLETLRQMQREQPALQEQNTEQLCQRVPVLNGESIVSGLLDQDGGDLDVDGILQGFLRQFSRAGGELRCDAAVQSLCWSSGQWEVALPHSRAAAPILVNAAGAWAGDIGELAGLGSLGLQPKRRTAVLVRVEQQAGLAEWPLTVDIDEQFYFKPDAGLLLVSPADATPSPPCDSRPEELDIALAIDRLESATSLRIKRVEQQWAGLRTFAADGEFVLGFDPRAKGFYWLAGQGGYGVQTAPALAQFAAGRILDSTGRRAEGGEELDRYGSQIDVARLL